MDLRVFLRKPIAWIGVAALVVAAVLVMWMVAPGDVGDAALESAAEPDTVTVP